MNSNTHKIIDIFKKISWLDNSRWKSYSDCIDNCSINLSSADITDSEKILTHFLCYISDRGMTYSQVWDEGGFVYSNIVSEYEKGKNIKELLNPDIQGSFFQRNEIGKASGPKYEFISKIKVPEDKDNLLVKDYGYKAGNSVIFTPRYYPSDLKSIMQTLMILNDGRYERNIIRFISFVLRELDGTLPLKRIAFSLHLLGYYNIGQPKSTEYNKIVSDAEDNKETVLKILNDKEEFEKHFKNFMKYGRFNKKRIWCSLRDYIKSPEFKGYMINGFEDIGQKDMGEQWNNLDLTELELPGDVWNNNPKFKKCVFGELIDTKNENSSRFIRNIYEDFKEYIDDGYPEMFDVTFDFVPMMCTKGLCDFCIFKEDNKLDQLCTKDKTKYCPVLLVSCGYINKCEKTECILL